MNVQEISQVLAKRSCGITPGQWHDLLQQLEQHGLYLIICSKKAGLAQSPVGGFIPMPSKEDELRLMTADELKKYHLSAEHQILPVEQSKVIDDEQTSSM